MRYNIRALIITYTILRVPFLHFWYNISQNPYSKYTGPYIKEDVASCCSLYIRASAAPGLRFWGVGVRV